MDGPRLDRWVGRLHQGTARCVISDLPVSYTEDDAPASETINANITSFVGPGLQMRYQIDGSYKGLVHIPVTEDNQYYDKLITISMIADDRSENYWTLHRYMSTIQSGQTGPNAYPIRDKNHRIYGFDEHYRNRRMLIPFIEIHMADDSFQEWQIIRYERCWPTDISDLNLNFLSPEPVTFTTSWVYEVKKVIRCPESIPNTPPKCVTN